MLFNKLLEDWSKFEIDNRTKYDATVASSGSTCSSKICKAKVSKL